MKNISSPTQESIVEAVLVRAIRDYRKWSRVVTSQQLEISEGTFYIEITTDAGDNGDTLANLFKVRSDVAVVTHGQRAYSYESNGNTYTEPSVWTYVTFSKN